MLLSIFFCNSLFLAHHRHTTACKYTLFSCCRVSGVGLSYHTFLRAFTPFLDALLEHQPAIVAVPHTCVISVLASTLLCCSRVAGFLVPAFPPPPHSEKDLKSALSQCFSSTNEDEMCNFYLMYWTDGKTLDRKTCFSLGPPFYYWARNNLRNIPDKDASSLAVGTSAKEQGIASHQT